MTTPELLPCPFCGNTRIHIRGNGIGDFYAACDDDYEGEEGCGVTTSDERAEEPSVAAARWNKRAYTNQDITDEQIERAARVIADREIYEGYNEVTRNEMIMFRMVGARMLVRRVMKAIWPLG